MGKKPLKRRDVAESKDVAPIGVYADKWDRQPRPQQPKRPPESTILGDLFLWIDIADECLAHPFGGLTRAADVAGFSSTVPILRCINRLEEGLGHPLIYKSNARNPKKRSPMRGGHLTNTGVMLAEIAVCIEHLWRFAIVARHDDDGQKAINEVKKSLFSILPIEPQRASELHEFGEIQRIAKKLRSHRSAVRFQILRSWTHRIRLEEQRGGTVDLLEMVKKPIAILR